MLLSCFLSIAFRDNLNNSTNGFHGFSVLTITIRYLKHLIKQFTFTNISGSCSYVNFLCIEGFSWLQWTKTESSNLMYLEGTWPIISPFFPPKINTLTSLFWVSRASNIWSQTLTLLVTESLKPTGEFLVVSLPAELEHLEGLWPLEVAHRPGCRLRYRVVGHSIGLEGSYKTLKRYYKTCKFQKNASAVAIFINIYSSLGLSSLM